jgi:fluoroquinolone resistance protein
MGDDQQAQLERLQRGDYFEDETFTGLDLTAIDLSGKELFRCTFRSCGLRESRWRKTTLEKCTFVGSDLSGASFDQTGLRGVRFESAKLLGVDFSRIAPHAEVAFVDSKLRYASFARQALRRTAFRNCSATDVTFVDVDLTEAVFAGTDLAATSFTGCTLTRTDFGTARGLFLEPARNRLKDTAIPVETAVQIAQHLGMIVEGFVPADRREETP